MLDHGQAASEVMDFTDDTTFEEECRPDVRVHGDKESVFNAIYGM